MKKNDMHINYAAKDDCRAIKQDGILWKALTEGELVPLVNLVKNKPDLELCFRGNSSTDSVTVYFNNNEFVRFYENENKTKIKCDFNRNHSRYYKDRKIINKQMAEEIKNREFEEFYALRKEVMESYFAEDKTIDYIKDASGIQIGKKKDCKYEKQEQQKLMTANTNRKNGYYIYDMEYAQAFESEIKKKKYNNEIEKLMKSDPETYTKSYNKPDSLAIRYEGGEPKALVFVELKTTRSAMSSGASSAVKHIEGMRNFVDMDEIINDGQFIQNRKIEAQKILEGYQQLGLHACGKCPIEDFSNLPIEYLLVISGNVYKNLNYNDTAKAYYNKDKIKQRIDATALKYGCGLIVLDPGNFELHYDKIIR